MRGNFSPVCIWERSRISDWHQVHRNWVTGLRCTRSQQRPQDSRTACYHFFSSRSCLICCFEAWSFQFLWIYMSVQPRKPLISLPALFRITNAASCLWSVHVEGTLGLCIILCVCWFTVSVRPRLALSYVSSFLNQCFCASGEKFQWRGSALKHS